MRWGAVDNSHRVQIKQRKRNMDVMELVVKPVKGFAKDSIRLVNKCTKPDKKGARLAPDPRRPTAHHRIAEIARRGGRRAVVGCRGASLLPRRGSVRSIRACEHRARGPFWPRGSQCARYHASGSRLTTKRGQRTLFAPSASSLLFIHRSDPVPLVLWPDLVCLWPRAEFTKISLRTALGFAVLGFIGFFVKLIFIPM